MHSLQFAHHPSLFGSAYGFVSSRFNGQRILWHMGESARFVTALALLPESDVGLLVSYNTPPADGTTILFRFLDVFYPIERVAHTSPQKVITWLGTLPVRATGEGEFVAHMLSFATSSIYPAATVGHCTADDRCGRFRRAKLATT